MTKLVCNLFGSPGSGKSVAAASIFTQLKKHHLNVGLVTEYARDAIIEKNALALQNQLFLWATQVHRIFCAYEHYDVVVTDAPILLGSIYNLDATSAMHQVILEQHQKYDNFNIMIPLDSDRPYSMVGRVHSLTESLSINNQIFQLLDSHDIPYLQYSDFEEPEIIGLILDAIS
jgi:ABC-type dipeptide/oligopeptide/nickel transport system ATPase component